MLLWSFINVWAPFLPYQCLNSSSVWEGVTGNYPYERNSVTFTSPFNYLQWSVTFVVFLSLGPLKKHALTTSPFYSSFLNCHIQLIIFQQVIVYLYHFSWHDIFIHINTRMWSPVFLCWSYKSISPTFLF